MKLLMYSHAFAPAVGGVETHAMHLARGLALLGREKVQLTVVTKTRGNGYDDSALPFRIVRRPGIVQLGKLIRWADVIHLAGPVLTPQILCSFLRKPTVVEHHGYQVVCPNGSLLKEPEKTVCPGHYMRGEYRTCLKCDASAVGWGASLKALLLTGPRRRLSKRATANICITQHVAERIQLPRTSIVYYGVPAQEISRDPEGIIQFAYLGRFVSEKGLPHLIEAAKILDEDGINFRLLMIGDGPERNELEQQVQRLGLSARIEFTGFLGGKELEEAVGRVSAVVMPSICEETAGLSAIEQMMRGRPVVVSDIGGLAEVTGDGGLKFPPGDAVALAKCLARLAEDSGLRAELGARARKRALTLFSMQRTVEDHLKVYENAFGRSK